ncbi:MAG: hypothetical protein ACI4XL_09305 [Bacillus sp. (in: firmicutes)]
MEAFLQWSGRKLKKGQMDPAYCRVVFYSKMTCINETCIDMTVQNKVMKITIINELADALEEQTRPFI